MLRQAGDGAMDRWGVWVWQKGESYPSGPRHVLAAEPPHPLLTFGILLRGDLVLTSLLTWCRTA